MRTLYAALALAILASVSQASPEVESLGLEREGMALIQEEEQPNQKVVDLTSKIKNLQKDIQDIRLRPIRLPQTITTAVAALTVVADTEAMSTPHPSLEPFLMSGSQNGGGCGASSTGWFLLLSLK